MKIFAVILIGPLIFFAIKVSRSAKIQKTLKSLRNSEHDLRDAINDFKALWESNWYISDRQYQKWKSKYAILSEQIDRNIFPLKGEDSLIKMVSDFLNFYDNGRKLYIDDFNADFVEKESPIIEEILNFKEIKGNYDQIEAIASDEDNTLLVAGAGTGKTTTILGKIAYLLERAKIDPREILLLSFTGRAVDELSSRINQKFGDVGFKVQTFHSFGLSILGKVLGSRPSLAFLSTREKKLFLSKQFKEKIKESEYFNKVVKYFAYYLKPIVLEPGFQNLDDYYKFVKTEQNITLQKEVVKSQQEVMIANFLYLNGVNYTYEKPYEFKTSNSDHRQYQPDFFLSDYGIYLEHFGINRDGQTRYTNNEQQNAQQSIKYRQDMDWKRRIHEVNGTHLVETYSYEFIERDWEDKLSEKLKSCGVKFVQRDMREVFDSMADAVTIEKIIQLFETFLDLSKSNGYDSRALSEKIISRGIPREWAFFELFAPIFDSYENFLKTTDTIDFHDMLIKATEFINEGKFQIDLKYIIIDEFQDFSKSKYSLVKALCNQNPDAKLFCVGDDWQSIFRFTGSDISLMTEFEQAYGFTRKNKLVITNRFNDNLAVVTNQFILKNPLQIKKEVRAAKTSNLDAVEIISNKKYADTQHLLHEILESLNRDSIMEKKISSVFILGRYRHNEPKNMPGLKGEFKNLSIEFLTIHSAKGSEADFVIIVDVKSGKHGFPSGVSDDPLLEIVLSKGEAYPHAEERRLMYVAMTRARNKVYIMTEDGNESVFVMELKGSMHAEKDLVRCQKCGGEMVRRKGPYGAFHGCANYPYCKNTIKIN